MSGMVRGTAFSIPLRDKSVNLCISSPPYFGQRSYSDDGEHYDGQIGSEPTPEEFLQALWDVMKEVWRVLADDGVVFINLGDKRSGSGAPGTTSGLTPRSKARTSGSAVGSTLGGSPQQRAHVQGERSGMKGGYTKEAFGRPKSKQLLPHRFAIGCADGLADPDGIGWIVRHDIVWCLSGGARVYAEIDGRPRPIMIRDLVRHYQAEQVRLWNGDQWTDVLGWNRSVDTDGALEIELRSGERIGCTPGHQWPTERGLLRADEVRVGDVFTSCTLPEADAVRRSDELPDDEVGWLVGLYIAEGSRSEQTLQFAGHLNETGRHDRLAAIAARFDGECHTYQTSAQGATCNLTGSILLGIIDRYVSVGTAHTKRLTVHAWQRSDRFLAAVARGYLEGDGHFDAKNDRWRLGFTANDEWAADLRALAARLRCRISVRRATHTGFGKQWPGWRGEWRWHGAAHHPNAKDRNEVVAIRASRARHFYDIGVADDPHIFALASGVLTHNSKPNGMPESVQDRPRDSHEYWFMLVKQGTYFSAIDEIRVPHVLPLTADMMAKRLGSPKNSVRHDQQIGPARGGSTMEAPNATASNPLGKVPDSVWSIPTEPLSLPEWLGVEHFAAFPTEWPRRLILGFAPNGICTVCHKGRFPVADVEREPGWTRQTDGSRGGSRNEGETVGQEVTNRTLSTIVGYACACTPKVSHRGKRGDWKEGRVAEREKGSDDFHAPGGKAPRRPDFTPVEKPMIEYQLDGWTAPPTTPAVVLDIFGGTGTTAMVARALGHTGVSLDLSYDYCRVARWRIFQSGHGARIESRTNGDRQGTLAL